MSRVEEWCVENLCTQFDLMSLVWYSLQTQREWISYFVLSQKCFYALKNDLGMNLVKFVTMVMVMLKKMGFSMEMMRTRKGFCEKAIVIVWHLVSGSSQPSRGIDIGTHENMMVIIVTVMIIKIIFQRQRIWNQEELTLALMKIWWRRSQSRSWCQWWWS